MRRLLVAICLLAATLWSAPVFARARSQLGPLCTTDTTPPDQMIDACTKIIALKVFKGELLATVYFWRAVGWNRKAITPRSSLTPRKRSGSSRTGWSTICAARPITTKATTRSRSPISTMR